MSYEDFAYVYDFLMKDAPYDEWLDWVKRQQKIYHHTGKRVLDLACGTGELSIRLAKNGYHVTGVDLSEDMLTVANQKAMMEGIALSLLQQNMCELEGLFNYDIVTIFCDSLNYLSTSDDVRQTFKHVYTALKPGGMFLFDVHSIYKMENIFAHHTFAENDDEVSYIWNCFEGEHPYSVEHDLSFFVLDQQTGLYERIDELHKQRTFSIEQYGHWLKEAGFTVKTITADFSVDQPSSQSERIFFTCMKESS
ncbi:class I SAM-dependent methyltransferase [Bacillus ginsengihumi]|uniref:Class I SAM-dependent methyltransferase n=1 Tax=Heyndrickxia ginsengihumi TaxID=363870 RepID=A0A6M0P5H6_9BACI|nr:class I SAM-dependent methyltransferase [Heyndrickxia ginsengihumi]NEY19727.1 class I SAM-dependent methyltransferase [Heyndrickxia ginsengihumi]